MKILKMVCVAMLLGAVSIEAVWADSNGKVGSSIYDIKRQFLYGDSKENENYKFSDWRDPNNKAVIQAVENNNFSKLSVLLKMGADVNARDMYGKTALMIAAGRDKTFAIGKGSQSMVKFLIENGADVNAIQGGGVPEAVSTGKTALLEACYYGNLEIAKYLISKGADIKAKDKRGKNCLFVFTNSSSTSIEGAQFVEFVKYFIENGIDVNETSSKDGSGDTILYFAVGRGDLELVKYLISKGADVNAGDSPPFLNAVGNMRANKKNGAELAKYLLSKGADVNAKSSYYSQTAIMRALQSADDLFSGGALSTIKFLLENGADINIKSSQGQTALDIALERASMYDEYYQLAEFLISKGAKRGSELN